jgi:DNA polymerase-3 subunit delta'
MLRESFMYNLDNAHLSYMTDEEEEFVRKFAQFVHVGNYIQLYNFLNSGLAEIEQNGSVRIIMTDLMLSMAGYLRMPRP